MAIRRAWSRFGALPAFPVVAAFLALALLTRLLSRDVAEGGAGFALVAVLAAYCVARPDQGWDTFWAVAAPNALAQLAHDVLGAPRWLYFVLLPIALVGAWDVDHDADDDAPAGDAPEILGR